MIYLVAGLDRGTLGRWHDHVMAGDASLAARIARGAAPARASRPTPSRPAICIPGRRSGRDQRPASSQSMMPATAGQSSRWRASSTGSRPAADHGRYAARGRR